MTHPSTRPSAAAVERAGLRKLKDDAADALDARHFRESAELYDRVAAADDDPTWLQRAGEAYRRAGDLTAAGRRFHDAAVAYARTGHTAKALAVCKLLRAMSPSVNLLGRLLAELEEQRRSPTPMRAWRYDPGVPGRSAPSIQYEPAAPSTSK